MCVCMGAFGLGDFEWLATFPCLQLLEHLRDKIVLLRLCSMHFLLPFVLLCLACFNLFQCCPNSRKICVHYIGVFLYGGLYPLVYFLEHVLE